VIELVAADPADAELRGALVRHWADLGVPRDPEWLRRYWALMEAEASARPPLRLLRWATARGARVGFAMGRLLPHWLFPERLTGYVAEVCVYRPYRRRGYGRAMASALARELRRAGAEAVELDVLPGNRGAMRFWARQGYRAAFIRYRG
jgi:ribosomal protein S18 acetylase RimI-like enzyme